MSGVLSKVQTRQVPGNQPQIYMGPIRQCVLEFTVDVTTTGVFEWVVLIVANERCNVQFEPAGWIANGTPCAPASSGKPDASCIVVDED